MHHDMFLSSDCLRSSRSQLKVLTQLQAQDLQPDAKNKTKCQHMVSDSSCGVITSHDDTNAMQLAQCICSC